MSVYRITLVPYVVARTLTIVTLILVLAHLGGQYSKLELGHGGLMGLVPLFNLSAEHNVPAYFSMLLMLYAALLLFIVGSLNRTQCSPHAAKWLVLAVGFVIMAFDEAFSAHERLMVPVRALLGVTDPVGTVQGETVLGFFYFAWVIPGIIIVSLLALYFWRFLWYQPAPTRYRFVLAALIYVGGAIGWELVGGRYVEVYGYDNWTYTFIATAEETFEIAGLILFVWALLKHCEDTYQVIVFGFEAPERKRASTR